VQIVVSLTDKTGVGKKVMSILVSTIQPAAVIRVAVYVPPVLIAI
jgi:hypothetical protein